VQTLCPLLVEEHASGLDQDVGAFGASVVDDVVLYRSEFSTLLGGAEGAAGVTYAAHPVSRPLGSAITHVIRARSLCGVEHGAGFAGSAVGLRRSRSFLGD
jgi:hypothetical protein